MTKEEAVKRLEKYGRVRHDKDFLSARIEAHRYRLKHARNEHAARLEQHRLDKLTEAEKANRLFMEDIALCLSYMPEREKEVLWHFYVRRTYDYIEILSEKLHVERSQIYRIKDKAILTFAALYTKCFY